MTAEASLAPDWLPPDRGGRTHRNVDGTLVAECTGKHCMVRKRINGKRTIVGGTRHRITEFAPGDNRKHGAHTHQPFMEALIDYDKALDRHSRPSCCGSSRTSIECSLFPIILHFKYSLRQFENSFTVFSKSLKSSSSDSSNVVRIAFSFAVIRVNIAFFKL